MHKIKGFTLLELMTALAVATILMVFSNSFAGLLRSNQVSAIVQQMITDLNYARIVAITRNTRITLCKSDANQLPRQCVDDNGETGWQQGWIVFVDINNDQRLIEPNNNLLRVRQQLSPHFTLEGNSPVKNYISYLGNGFSRKQNESLQMGSLALCHPDASLFPLRLITISSAGRTKANRFKSNNQNNLGCGF